MIKIVATILTHEYFIAVYGVTLWYAILFVIHAKSSKTKKGGELWKSFWGEKKYNIGLTYFFLPWFIMFDDDVIGLYNKTSEFDINPNSKIYYSLCGPILELFVIRWILRLFTKK